MNKVEENLKKRINEMPEGQTFTMNDLVSEHNPGLWKHLCYMDDGQHRREDGCLFVADEVRLSFTWIKR